VAARRLTARPAVAALAALVAACALAAPAWAGDRFPRDFLWGTATAGFQVEAGGSPSNADRRSDWWAFTHDAGLIRSGVVSGDRVERGPGFWRTWRADLDRARTRLAGNAIRLGVEWSRIFPRSTAGVRTGTSVSRAELRRLDRLADRSAVRRYGAILRGARARGLRVMLTLSHFTLPLWVHDPLAVRRAFAGRGADDPVPGGLRRAGWLDASTVGEFRKFAAYAAWKFGDDVDLWVTLNEPLVTVSQGFVSIPGVTGVKAPAVLSYPAALRALANLGLANAAAYDAVRARDRRARVGVVLNMLDWRPSDPARPEDATAARHADQVFNRSFLELAVNGWYDTDADGVRDPGELRPALRGKADFVGVNHYSPAFAQALAAPVTPTVPLFDFLPQITYRGTGNPQGPPCPATCTDFGWVIDPTGLANVVRQAASYGKPVYVTENGIDDAGDRRRPAYLRGYLRALRGAMTGGADVRGYFHWSLLDNFEWAEGFDARFGLYAYDPRTLARRERPSARLFRQIARSGVVP
jgi:beta-glucosidase/6-phospho-beta-glucosidase/beta-galactosidase